MSLPDPIRPAIQAVVYHAPFLAHLALALRWRMDPSIETACTNGVEVRVSPEFFSSLPPEQQAGLVAHEALHCALRHNERGKRFIQTPVDAARWNVAADITVNAACALAGFRLPPGSIRDPAREHLSVEEIYRALRSGTRSRTMGKLVGSRLRDLNVEDATVLSLGPDTDAIDWPSVIRRADILARRHGGRGAGSTALGIDRELRAALGQAQVDWRSVLWRYLAESPSDWGGWDRRLVWQGSYIPTLDGQRLRAVVGIDTSGSIDSKLLHAFLAELVGILGATRNLSIHLYWTDTQLYGPTFLDHNSDPSQLTPQGGGGTNLGPLFLAAASLARDEGTPALPVIYLTDGFGPTLDREPDSISALWVIPEHGRQDQPWGEVVSMEVPS